MVDVDSFVFFITTLLLVISMFCQFIVRSGVRKVFFAILSDINLVLFLCVVARNYNVLPDMLELIFLVACCCCIKVYLSIFLLKKISN
ncbi:MAG: hypothetical protein ISQ34_02020 [Rickettsiales bacterium]|nr:hypothetical protein [Rickettsiales bacterium]